MSQEDRACLYEVLSHQLHYDTWCGLEPLRGQVKVDVRTRTPGGGRRHLVSGRKENIRDQRKRPDTILKHLPT